MGIFKNDDQKSSQFGFDEKSMAGKAVKAVRWIYAITGVLALIAGIALLFAPAKSLVFLTTVLGFYFVITAAIRLFTHMTQSAVKSHNGPADRLQSVGGACR